MKTKTGTSSNYSKKDFWTMSIEEKFNMMDELYRKAVQNGSFKRHLKARRRGVEEVARRWQRLRELTSSEFPNQKFPTSHPSS
jgi:hypothetical protein